MAGGRRRQSRNPTAGGRRFASGGGSRRSAPQFQEIRFAPAGEGGRRPRGNGAASAVPYTYPSVDSGLGSFSDVSAVFDLRPSSDEIAIPVYSCIAAGLGSTEEREGEEDEAGHVGLGFQEQDGEEEIEVQVELDAVATPECTKGRRFNPGFVSIGGVKIYTEDTSSPEEDFGSSDDGGSEMDSCNEEEGINEDGSDSQVGSGDDDGEDEEARDEDDGDDDEDEDEDEDDLSISDGSDISDDLAADYIDGVGGTDALMTSSWLTKERLCVPDESDEDDDGDERNKLVKKNHSNGSKKIAKLGGTALMNASKTYGMKLSKSAKWAHKQDIDDEWGFENMLFVKEGRMPFKGKKKAALKAYSSELSRSWPSEHQRNRGYRSVPGEKKKHRKEVMEAKRHLRMINRGVDLEQINNRMKQMVVDQVDMLSFQPMHSRDCSQVQRLASIYHLKSCRQGSGKKRFLTVTLTEESCFPSAADKDRLNKLLRAGINDDLVSGAQKPQRKCSAPNKLSKKHTSVEKRSSKNRSLLAEQPVTFVSSGTMEVDPESKTTNVEISMTIDKCPEATSVSLGAFEMHTKGFGSKMMAKMGFDGRGLGKDSQGMVQPIEPVQRPKSLGLGMQFEAETSEFKPAKSNVRFDPVSPGTTSNFKSAKSKAKADLVSLGSFEKHTKGFGSKMMVRMGFVPGTGLGKDRQGIVTPLNAVRRPKARGLGAER